MTSTLRLHIAWCILLEMVMKNHHPATPLTIRLKETKENQIKNRRKKKLQLRTHTA